MQGAASVLVYAIVTAVMGRDVLAHLGSTIASDPGDPLLTAAILKWNATHVPLTDAWYQFPIFYPTRDTLTFSEHLLGLSVIASPIYWLTSDAVVTYNLTLLLTFPLCAAAMYALVFRLTGSAAGAFVSGIAFGFAPYRISQLPHIQMLATFWAPLALLGLHAYIETRRRRWLMLYAAAWMLQGAANGYALVFLSVLVGLWTLWFVVLSRDWHAFFTIGLASVVALVPLAPVLYKYATVHRDFGFGRGYWEIRSFSADLAALLCASPLLRFWGWVRVSCGPEGDLFPGVALTLLSLLGLGGILVQARRYSAAHGGRSIRVLRRLLLFVAAVAAVAIVGLLVGGRFMLETGLLRVEGSTFLEPAQVLVLSLALTVALSPGVRTAARHSPVIGFYLLGAIVMWTLALGPVTTFMGSPGMTGPFRLLMSLPGVGSLRVPARFWLMTVLCLSVVAGVVVATGTRGRSRRVVLVTVLLAASGVLSDGWVDRIRAAPLPDAVPGAALLAGATVLDAPPGILSRDIASVFRAVNGGWKTVNGYSGWWPSYYHALVAAGRAEADDLVIPFQQLGELHVVVGQDAAGLRSLIERQPGVSIVASDRSLVHYRLPPRSWANTSPLGGRRLDVRELGSACSTESLPRAIDGDDSSLWQCARWDGRQALTVDLGEVGTVGGIVHSLGSQSRSFPLALSVETSEDGVGWSPAWSGNVLAKAIAAAMEDPKRLRIPIAFSPRQARFLRLRAAPYDVDVPWTIAELEVWSGGPPPLEGRHP